MQLVGSSMVTSPNGQGVILVGGFNHSEKTYSDALIELTGSDIHAVLFIRNVVKICPVWILTFCIVVSYFRGHILASCFLIFMPEL